MSSIVNLDLVSISAKNLLPKDIMIKVFNDSLLKCNGVIKNNVLVINGFSIGKISITDRIVLSTYSENVHNIERYTKVLRDTFTKLSELEFKNYQYYLKQQKLLIEKEAEANLELKKHLEEISKKEIEATKAYERQHLPSCEAIVEELKEAAENQGYDVSQIETKNGVQLQFVRRVY